MVLRHAQQHVDDLEPLGARGVVDPGDLHELLVFVLIAQETQRILDRIARDGEHDLAMLLLRRDEHSAERGGEPVETAFVRSEARCGVIDDCHV